MQDLIYNLPHIIENAAIKMPGNEAFRCGTDSLTYAELRLKMHQLAKCLADSGVRKGDRVAIYMNRCLESAIAVYGIMKAGAVYVPMDPQSPVERSLFVLDDCGVDHLITTPQIAKYLPPLLEEQQRPLGVIGFQYPGLSNTLTWEQVFSCNLVDYKPVEVLEQDLAYIMYTSGTTGSPKGIIHTHYSALSYARLSAELYAVSPEDRIANHAPLFFDISTFGYFTGPLRGATTVIIPEAYTKLPASLAELMERERLSIWYSVPLALVQLLLNGLLEEKNLGSLRWVLFGGEHFTTKYLARLMKLWPHARFSNVYGPAEVNQCTFYHLKEIPSEDRQIPIGTVWGNTEYKILDEGGSDVAMGEAGELLIRSATMMKGYWNNPALSKKALYTIREQAGQELVFYKTGDLVMESEKGELILLGRNDNQVKVRGYRIELEEVESVLKRHEMVHDAVAVAVDDKKGGQELWAGILPLQKSVLSKKDLRKHCRRWLPPYAIPEKIVEMSQFPRTRSEKIDRGHIKELFVQYDDGKSDLNIY